MLRSGTRLIALLLSVLVAGWPIHSSATSFDPLPREQEPSAQEMDSGDTVFLFHSGTAQGLRSLKIGDVLGVSRIGPDGRNRIVGAIQASAFVGEFCLRGEVVEGKILPHDLVENDHVYFLVIPEALCRI